MSLPTPRQLKNLYPLSDSAKNFIKKSRETLSNILKGEDDRLVLIVGPCSIHNFQEGLLFAQKLKELFNLAKDSSFIVMRAFIEKPRTRFGWRGLVHDPYLNGSYDLAKGLSLSRDFLVHLAEMGIPAATEFVTPSIAPYIEDTISWGCIGARTSSSQIHRLLASSLLMPIGFKNSVEGCVESSINGALVAKSSNTFIHMNEDGKIDHYTSQGNPHTHIVLRGALNAPNYEKKNVSEALKKSEKEGLNRKICIDCSHGNSGGYHPKQQEVFESVVTQIREGNQKIFGLMLESNLLEGKQSLPAEKPGVSITDGCLSYSSTAELISSISSGISISLTQS